MLQLTKEREKDKVINMLDNALLDTDALEKLNAWVASVPHK
jgi:hypothetical protein